MIYNDFCGNKVSRLGFGCMRFPSTFEETKKCLDYAYNNGVNYFDTAYVYDNSEVTLGKIIKDYKRDTFYVTSKLPIDKVKEASDVEKLFSESCLRLGVSYIDYYLLHALDQRRVDLIKEHHIIETLVKLKEEGKIKKLGFSIHAPLETLKNILALYDFDFAQIQLNYFDMVHEPGFDGYLELTKRNIPVVIMEPVKGGMLANIPSPLNKPFTDYDKDASNASFAFKFLMQYENIKVILSGMSSFSQVVDNINTFDKEESIDPLMIKAIDEVKSNLLGIYKVSCTNCKYCMPCPFGVNIPLNFKIMNNKSLGEVLNNEWFKNMKYPVDGASTLCKECGACLKKCPQHINIPEMLKLAR